MPMRNLTTIAIFAITGLICYSQAPANRDAREIARAIRIIAENHVEEVRPRELFENAMNGMVSGLDRYSSYIPPVEYQEVEESLDQKFGGVGIIVELNPKSKRLTVLSPLVGTPAYRAGLQSGDTITKVDDASTEGLNLEQSVKLMRGEIGEPVTLEVARRTSEEPLVFTVVRDVIPIESVLGDRRDDDGNWVFDLESDKRIRYVRLTTFGKQSVSELETVLKPNSEGKFPYEALILDLRGNAGGLLSSAVRTSDLFVNEGRVVSTRGRDGRERDRYDASSRTLVPRSIPMVVLVNKYSASASEIVAACLQDHGRAVVVGERTWGKGTVQNIISLEGGKSALKLTTASYWRPSGKNIHRTSDAEEEDDWGVSPNKGFEIKVERELAEKIMLYRRSRDVVRNGDGPNGDEVEPVADPQFEAAVEFITNKLDGTVSVSTSNSSSDEDDAGKKTEKNEN